MTPRLVLNYEYYTYKNDYDDVIQLEICLRCRCQWYPRALALVPRGGDGTPPPCESQHSVTPKTFSATPSTVGTYYQLKQAVV